MEEESNLAKWLAREAHLSHKHEEILAKREMLLAENESRMSSQQKKLQLTTHDFQRTKARNEQLVQELKALQSGLGKKATMCTSNAQFISLQESYWKMVKQEYPRWIAGNEACNSKEQKERQ
ncbi:uncharacterized protein C3orf14 homolog [Pocillopora damicornis]|nr:uncharacterized protein C3orf14 homolog [Pocillopora damicornis]